jgi:hypothetical protein
MEKVPTAKELFDSMLESNDEVTSTEMMIEFAKIHVEAALKDVKQQLINALNSHLMLEENICDVIENINNYSLENVK